MQNDDQQFRKFLLGSASEGIELEVGVRLIADEHIAVQLDHAEHELVEDYLDGLLSPEETRLFHENFLVSPRRQDLLLEVKTLRAASRNLPARPVKTYAKAAKTSGLGYFSFLSRPLLAAAGLVTVLLAGWLVWFAFLRDSRTPLEIEYASLNRRDLSDAAKMSNLSVVNLVSANFRDAASTATHPLSGLTDQVMFRLALPVSEPEGAEFSALIEKSGKRVFSVSNARVFRNAFGSELRFLAPKQVLQPGLYQIEIAGPGNRYQGTTFQFRVE